MREQDQLAALVGDLGDGRRAALDARGIRHLAVLHRDVEVDAYEHALAGEVSLIKCFERHRKRRLSRIQISFPIATAVSAMRLEKPHSLSYHAITRTSVP